MGRFRRFRFSGTLVALATCAVLSGTTAAHAIVPPGATVAGAGSTWLQNAMSAWIPNYSGGPGLLVNYAGTGSIDGRDQFRNGTVDFAATEVPYGLPINGNGVVTDPPPTRPFRYLPVAAGGIVFAYSLPNGIRLRLSSSTIAKIFTRVITQWNDPAIKAENASVALPNWQITPVVRTDDSASTEIFTQWLASQQPALWNAYCLKAGLTAPCGATATYPLASGMIGRSLSTGVTAQVAMLGGAITYVEQNYATSAGLPTAKVLNAAGYYTAPSAGAVSVSLLSAQVDNSGFANLDRAFTDVDPRAYPLPELGYLIVPTSTDASFTTAKGLTLGGFATYALCSGTTDSMRLGYAPLPQNLVQADLTEIPSIPGATTPAIDAATCAAPTGRLIDNTPQPQACDRVGPAECGDEPTETISTDLQPGSLVVSVDGNPQVVLPSPVLDPSGALLRTSGSLSALTVTDNRAGDPGWNVSAQVGDFSDGAGHSIAGLNLGWTPSVIDAATAQTVTVGAPVAPAVAGGLSVARTWASGTGLGTAHLGADVELDVPTSTLAGTYSATLTVTAI